MYERLWPLSDAALFCAIQIERLRHGQAFDSALVKKGAEEIEKYVESCRMFPTSGGSFTNYPTLAPIDAVREFRNGRATSRLRARQFLLIQARRLRALAAGKPGWVPELERLLDFLLVLHRHVLAEKGSWRRRRRFAA